MPLLEDRTASFVVRIWDERRDLPDSPPEWRGMIEHIGSGRRMYFRELRAIQAFMRPFLESLGVDPGQGFWESMDAVLQEETQPHAEPDTPVDRIHRKGSSVPRT